MSRYYLDRKPHSIVFATSVNNLYENHKINFDEINIGAGNTRHTSLDWFLIPTERPSIDKATVKEHYIDIPGKNGGLDLTESLTGYPLYNYIEGSFEFTILNDRKLPVLNSIGELVKEKDISWEVLNRDIRGFLNGKECFMMLEDDPSWYYKGRFTVGRYDASEPANSKIVIEYKVEPFKKLSSYIYNPSPLNVFFDTMSIAKDDLAELTMSFLNKTETELYYGVTKSYYGTNRGELPCGSEVVPITFIFDSPLDDYNVTFQYTGNGRNIIRELDLVQGKQTTKIKDVVLSNKSVNGVLYSDYRIFLAIYPYDDFDETKEYNQGDRINFLNEQNINFILIAKENLSPGVFDLSKWDVYEAPFKDGVTYTKDDAENSIVVDWSVFSRRITVSDVYKPVKMSMIYDIGVM